MTQILKNLLKNKLSDTECKHLIGSFDVVGDMAITIIPPELVHKESIIAQSILESNNRIKVVAKRAGHYGGDYRTIPLVILAGENRKETEHKEYGIKLLLNPEKVYYSTRSAGERKRVADMVSPEEHVLVMFSGIGPYPLHIEKFSKAASIIGIEKNPVAHYYAIENLTRNRVRDRITLLCGDVLELLPQLNREFNRIIMPLPKTADRYLNMALEFLQKHGWLHYYDFEDHDQVHKSTALLEASCLQNNRKLIKHRRTICGHTGPHTHRICIDGKIA